MSRPYGFAALLDSGSSHCFISPKIIKKFHLQMNPVHLPLPLSMFDGTSVLYVSEKITLDISFPYGEIHNILFFIAPLDSSCEAVLGLNWLVKYNPLVDWTICQLTFHTAISSVVSFPVKLTSASPHLIAACAVSLSDPSPDI